MTNNMYDSLDKGTGDGVEASRARRTASIGALWNEESEQFLADLAQAKAEGMKLSPSMTMAAGYAQGYKDAAAKGQI